MPNGGFLLSRRGLDQVAGGSFELISRDTLNPQCPAYRSAASGLLDAFRSEVQVCPSTQLPLPYVRHQPARCPHQPQQFGFVGLLSAAKARADRPAHTSSLVSRAAVQVRTRSPAVSRAISRRQARPDETDPLAPAIPRRRGIWPTEWEGDAVSQV
jgi:hypothetical protein